MKGRPENPDDNGPAIFNFEFLSNRSPFPLSSRGMLKHLLDWYSSVLDQWGYWAVGLLMAVESTFFPIPSEVIVPPAAYKAWSGGGLELLGTHYSGWTAEILLVITAAVGSWLGAAVMYWLARLAGRPLVLRYGKYVFISADKVAGAERWAAHYGAFGIFASRMLPVVRHLIGIPAGIVRMNFWIYSLYTLAGAASWSAVLCWLGVKVGGQISQGQMHQVTCSLLAFLIVIGVLYYFFVHRHMKKKAEG
jgi:membrane protein DedA with SNARE-associated domain